MNKSGSKSRSRQRLDHSTAWNNWGEDGIEEAKSWVDDHNQK